MVPTNTLADPQNVEMKKAEWALMAYLQLIQGNRALTPEESKAFADGVWNYMGQSGGMELRSTRRKEAHPTPPNILNLPKWALNKITILHEISHLLLGWKNVQPHGPEFAGLFLDMVGRFYDTNARNYLEQMYLLHGVEYDNS